MTIRQGKQIIANTQGTRNYDLLENKPKIDGVELSGEITLDDLNVQSKLSAGTGIEIVNGVISNTQTKPEWGKITGNITEQTALQQELAKAGTPDDITVVKTQENKLQAIGIIEKNKNLPKYDWIGTLVEYTSQNIETLHPDWVCYITDDLSGGTSVYTKNEVNELLDVKTNTDLDNLSSIGQAVLDAKQDIATAVNYDNITNCITEIPQDIKLELNDGTLTLKAGSKVYVPNGFEKLKKYYKDVVTTKYWKEVTTGSRELEYACYYSSGELGDEYYYAKAPIGSDLQVYGTRSKEVASSSSELGAAGTLVFSSLNEDTAVFGVTFNRYRDGDLYIDTTATEVVEGTPEDYTYTTEETETIEVTADDDWTKVEEINTDVKKFDEISVTTDKTVLNKNDAEMYICVYADGSALWAGYKTGGTVTERPVNPIQYAVYYNTTTNTCEAYWSDSWHKMSLPIAVVTKGAEGFISIDQVFNGFGYIGSTVFALPGVKGLLPNGRNADGSLKNIEFTVDKVLTRTFSANAKTVTYITGGGIYLSGQRVFDFEKNAYVENGGLIYQTELTKLTTDSNGQITLFSPKLSYRAVDYSDSSWVSAQAMPSGKYIDLTLGASGSTYTAPANGWVSICKKATAVRQLVLTYNQTTNLGVETNATSEDTAIRHFVPVRKGDVFTVIYSAAGTLNYFRFIYCEGEN